MISTVPAIVTEHIRLDHSAFCTVSCPHCEERITIEASKAAVDQVVIPHKCKKANKKIFFFNGVAMSGVEDFNRFEKTSRAVK